MKYYSEVTQETYDTAEACEKAEKGFKQLGLKEKLEKERESYERKAAAKRVEDARIAMQKAQKTYRDELKAFISKYKTYHYSSSDVEDYPATYSLFDFFFN